MLATNGVEAAVHHMHYCSSVENNKIQIKVVWMVDVV